MTAAEKAQLFGQIFRLLDSDQEGERNSALNRLHARRDAMGWPTFGDVLRKLENAVTREQLDAAQSDAAQWKQAHDDRAQENTALARRNAALAAHVVALRTVLLISGNWRYAAALAVVAALLYGAYALLWPDAGAVPAAAETRMRDVLSRTRWGSGDTIPAVIEVNGIPYWVVVRGTIDGKSHTDARGQPIERHCLELFARPAVRDHGAYLTPSPYVAFGFWMRWPERAAECRMPGKDNS